jgi:glucokinase
MISRILHLLMIDILVVGVSVRRGEMNLPKLGSAAAIALDEAGPEQEAPKARPTGPGVSAAGALANLTTHSRSGG